MKKTIQKVILSLFTLCLLFSMSIGASASADAPQVGDKFSVVSEDGGQAYFYTVMKTEGSNEVEFSSNVDSSLVSTYSGEITIPSKVTYKEVEFTVTGIGFRAFESKSITKVTLPNTIKYIGQDAFYTGFSAGDQLTCIELQEGLEVIGERAFYGRSGLTTLEIPSTVTTIGDGAFSYCTNLAGEFEIPSGVDKIGLNTFQMCTKLTEISIPDSVTEIGASAFSGCGSLEKINLPDGITKIGASAFSSCTKLKELDIPDSVTEIGKGAFAGCNSLSVLEIPEGVKEGLADALDGFDVNGKQIIFPEGSSYQLVDGVLYNGTTLEKLLDDSVTEVTIPEGVTVIPEKAFYYNSQKGTGPENLATVTFPSTLKEIGKSAFQKTKLTSVIIPDGVTTIDYAAFGNISTLETVVIPASVTSIGDYAFSYADKCDGITIIMLGETPPTFGSNVFSIGTDPVNINLIVPETAIDNYKDVLSGKIGNIGSDTPAYALTLESNQLNPLAGETKTITVTSTVPDGYKLVMTNSDNTIATAELSGNIITVQALKNGSTTIRVSIVSEDESITLVTKSCSVVVGASYTITIVYGNGSADGIVYISQGKSYELPPAPTKPGYIFMGWRGVDGVTYQPGDEVAISGNTSFKAIWANMPDITPGTPDEPDDEPDVDVFPFYDVSAGAWYYDAVKYVWEHELMNGVSATQFSPNTTLNRAMIWTMLARLDGVNTDGGASWYAKAQEWAVAEGVSDGTDPMGNVTREQLVTMLWRFKGEPTVDFLLTAKDADTVSSWAYEAMRWAVAEGIIEGDENGLVTPTATATRAQAAAIFMRFIEL